MIIADRIQRSAPCAAKPVALLQFDHDVGERYGTAAQADPLDTLVAVHRTFEDGAIREAFRTLRPRGTRKPMRAFSFLEVEGEEEPGEDVNLAKLAREDRK